MAWMEASPVQQRYDFVHHSLEGQRSFAELCRAYGVARKTGYKWLARFNRRGEEGLEDASRARKTQERQTPREIVDLLVAEKMKRPRFGPKKLVACLAAKHPSLAFPAPSTAGTILKRLGLVESRQRRRTPPAHDSDLRQVTGPNSTWCADFKGQFRLYTSEQCYPATLMDACSRKLLRCVALRGTRRRTTLDVWVSAFKEFGLPNVIRTDNGIPFVATTGLLRLSGLAVHLIELGIAPEYIRRGAPQENGALERMHRTLKAATTKPHARSFEEQQARFDEFVSEYNSVRPHEALGMKTPDDVYVPSDRRYPRRVPEPRYPSHVEPRLVTFGGTFGWKRHAYRLAPALAGKLVGVEHLCPGLLRVQFFDKVLALVDELDQSIYFNTEWHLRSTEL